MQKGPTSRPKEREDPKERITGRKGGEETFTTSTVDATRKGHREEGVFSGQRKRNSLLKTIGIEDRIGRPGGGIIFSWEP